MSDQKDIFQLYAKSYRSASEEQLLGEVSTAYSMLPESEGVAERAHELLPEAKIIYVVRDPIKRALSHHQHMINWSGDGQMDADINLAIDSHPEIVNYSCYAMQLEPWVKEFGKSNILIIRFEDYVSRRSETLEIVFQFLGVTSAGVPIHDSGLNRGETRRYAGRFVFQVYKSKFFRNILKPLTPVFLKKMLRRVLLRKTRRATIPPTNLTVDKILERVQDDALKLQEFLGSEKPIWDLEASRNDVIARSL
jgi:hypothetical protein